MNQPSMALADLILARLLTAFARQLFIGVFIIYDCRYDGYFQTHECSSVRVMQQDAVYFWYLIGKNSRSTQPSGPQLRLHVLING